MRMLPRSPADDVLVHDFRGRCEPDVGNLAEESGLLLVAKILVVVVILLLGLRVGLLAVLLYAGIEWREPLWAVNIGRYLLGHSKSINSEAGKRGWSVGWLEWQFLVVSL